MHWSGPLSTPLSTPLSLTPTPTPSTRRPFPGYHPHQERMGISKQELITMLEEEELKDAMLIVFANKQVSWLSPLPSRAIVSSDAHRLRQQAGTFPGYHPGYHLVITHHSYHPYHPYHPLPPLTTPYHPLPPLPPLTTHPYFGRTCPAPRRRTSSSRSLG